MGDAAIKVLVATGGDAPSQISLWRPMQDGVQGFLVSPEDANWKEVIGLDKGDRALALCEKEGSYYWVSLPDELNQVPRVLENTIQIFRHRKAVSSNWGLRSFSSGDALNLASNYHVPWPDLEDLVDEMSGGKWLLLAAPFQSGKSTLLTAIGALLKQLGFLVVLTTLNEAMVDAANNRLKDERDAADDFYNMLVDKICEQSAGKLKRRTGHRQTGAAVVTDIFRAHGTDDEEEIVWLVDEAQILNSVHHNSGMAVYNLLASLREAKRECIARNPLGRYRLASFSLCGLPRLSALIGDSRRKRVSNRVGAYPPSSHDPLRPFQYSGRLSPLSRQIEKEDWQVNKEQVGRMLAEFARDRNFLFKLDEDSALAGSEKEHEEAMEEISSSIVELTGGRLGLVGCCCELVQRASIRTVKQWLKAVHSKRLQSHVFNNRVFDQLIRNVAGYSDEVKQVILACIESMDGSAHVDSLDAVLEAIDDGVLMEFRRQSVRFTSTLLLSSLLESCMFAPIENLPPPTDSLPTLFASAITFMDPRVFLSPKSLDSTGQPSEYSIQWQFFKGLQFMLQQKLYSRHEYKVLVEVKESEENGQRRRRRMDGYMEDRDAPKQGLELQVGSGNKQESNTIEEHIVRCISYGELHKCEMSYMYFDVGTSDSAAGAKGRIEKLAVRYPWVTCWYVQFDKEASLWTIQRLESAGWSCECKPCPPKFPKLLLSTADPYRKRQRTSQS